MTTRVEHLSKNLKDRDIFIDGICHGRMVRLTDDDNCCKDLRAGASSKYNGYDEVGIAGYWMDY